MGINVRKAPHCFGWDIMPRAVSAGIWRDVELQYKKKYDFRYLYFKLQYMDGNKGVIGMLFDSDLPPKYVFDDITFKIKGSCGKEEFTHQVTRKTGSGKFLFNIPNIKLWWPKNYGEPNLYTITVDAYGSDGKHLLSKTVRRGFRTVVLDRTDVTGPDGRFNFVVNGTKIMAVGTLIDRNKWNEKRYLEFDLETVFSRLENSTLQAVAVLLHKDSLCPDDGKILLDELDEHSQRNASGVSQDLKYALRESIELLGNEVLYDMATRLKRDFDTDPVDANQLTLECLRYMYRMLFVRFALIPPKLSPARKLSYIKRIVSASSGTISGLPSSPLR